MTDVAAELLPVASAEDRIEIGRMWAMLYGLPFEAPAKANGSAHAQQAAPTNNANRDEAAAPSNSNTSQRASVQHSEAPAQLSLSRAITPTLDALHYAERSLVSGAVKGDAACLEALRRLAPDVFLDPLHRVAAETVDDVVERGEVPSLETVSGSLLRNNRLNELSVSDLCSITDMPASLDPEARAAELTAAWSHRRLADGLTRLSGMAQGLPAEVLRDAVGDLLEDLPVCNAAIESLNPLHVDSMPEPTFSHGPRPGTVAVLAGASGLSKSYFGLQLAASGAANIQMFETFSPARSMRIQMWNFEDAPSAVRDRLHSIFYSNRALEGPTAKALQEGRLRFFFPEGPMFVSDQRGRMEVTPLGSQVAKLVTGEKPDHVFLDNLALFAVVQSEDNATFAFIMGWLSRLAKASGSVIWVVHHASKAGAGQASQNSIRGGSALVSASRYAMTFTPVDESDPANKMVRLTVVKDSYAQPPAPVVLSRGLGGVLHEEQKPTFRPEAVADSIRAWLVAHPEARIKESGINRRSPDGTELLAHLLSSSPWLTQFDIKTAVAAGMKAGILKVQEVHRSEFDRHRVTVLVPGDASDDDE